MVRIYTWLSHNYICKSLDDLTYVVEDNFEKNHQQKLNGRSDTKNGTKRDQNCTSGKVSLQHHSHVNLDHSPVICSICRCIMFSVHQVMEETGDQNGPLNAETSE